MSGEDRPPDDAPTSIEDLYQTLGVRPDASADDLTDAYRRLARAHHPDSNPGAAKGAFADVTDAYDVLRDPERRRSYDAIRRQRRAAAEAAADLRIPIRHEPSAASPLPEEIELRLSFDQAALGSTATVEVPTPTACAACGGSGVTAPATCRACGGAGHTLRQSGGINIRRACDECDATGHEPPSTCSTCTGRGHVLETREVRLRVPPGTEDGTVLRFKAPPDQREVRAIARVSPHAYFGRRDRDLILRLPLTITEAALGAVVTVPTLQGAVTIRVPAGTPTGRTFRVRGRGVPDRDRPGDLLATVEVVVPTTLNDDQRAGLEAFAAATPSPRAHLEVDTGPP